MTITRAELLKTAMDLPEGERLLLATELLETVSDDLPEWSIQDAEFEAELERRLLDGTPRIPWEAVRSQLWEDFSR